MTTPIVHITPAEQALQAQLDHSRACVQQMSRLNELMVSELATARVEIAALKAQPVTDVTKILLDVVPGDGSGFEVYATCVADVEKKLTDLGTKLEDALGECETLRAKLKAQPVQHVGESSFEAWFEIYSQREKGTKQLCRDAYAAGMSDPVAQPVQEPEKSELVEMKARKDAAYLERNQLVALVSKLFPAGKKRTAIEGWSDDWHGCVYIDLPTGQASWHYHDSQAHLFDHLAAYQGNWDGHSTEQKYERIAKVVQPVQPIDMVLHCPKCHTQHVDAPDWRPVPSQTEFAPLKWDNPPHRSHLCHACGCIWRPADVPTNGVAAIKTKGSNDSAPVQPVQPAPLTDETIWQLAMQCTIGGDLHADKFARAIWNLRTGGAG